MSTPYNTLQESYNNLVIDVKSFMNEYETTMIETGVYKGIQILFSNIIIQPKVLFIGINPGPGYFNHHNGERVKRYDPLEQLEYNVYDYTLANETNTLFEMANCLPVLESQSMKTNCCFFATNNEGDLTKLLNKIMHSGRPNIYREVEAWTKRIIEMVAPKIIICEGKSAYTKVADHIEMGKKDWLDGFGYYKSSNDIHVLGYERSFSNILQKEKVAIKLRELIQAID